jgi:phage-related minor tail protein
VNKGNLEELENVPDRVRVTAERTISDFDQIADALVEYTH